MKPYQFILILLAILGGLQIIPNAISATVLLLLVSFRYLYELDFRPAILELASLIATVQLVVAPVVMYAGFNTHYRHHMYVAPEIYFALAIPAVCLYSIGLTMKLPFGAHDPAPLPKHLDLGRAGMLLVGAGTLATAMAAFAPGQIGFLFYLLAQLRYVGAIYLYFSGYKHRWFVIAFAFSALYATAARYGMFHEILLWISLAASYSFLVKRRTVVTKLGYLAFMVAIISVVQLVKTNFREDLLLGKQASLGDSLIRAVASEKDTFGRDWQESMVIRLNQGWLISKAIEHVPSKVPFAGGETILDALYAATLPRALNPRKAMASGRENLNRFTGLKVSKDTSMGLGPLGEGYVNFGNYGAMIVMLAFGMSLNAIFRLMCGWSFRDPFFLFCIPVVFLQAIKMETEFLTIFNHLAKALIVVWVVYYFWISQSVFFQTRPLLGLGATVGKSQRP